jgi:hypothetical protein
MFVALLFSMILKLIIDMARRVIKRMLTQGLENTAVLWLLNLWKLRGPRKGAIKNMIYQ